MVFCVLCATVAAQSASESDASMQHTPTVGNNEAEAALQRALYFADLYNWHASRTYFINAEQLFDRVGDKKNVLHAHFGAIRAGAAEEVMRMYAVKQP